MLPRPTLPCCETSPSNRTRAADQVASKFAKLAVMLGDAKRDVLTFMSFPKAHRTKIASRNPLERVNAEIKPRTDVVGIFPNDAAIVRLIGGSYSSRTTSGNYSAAPCSSKDSKP